ncbi:MurR/RpiR family transcriptional regulator, partial [Pediococcus acidilactici]|nr:MurR/RpiR family transcriptional regulator [Pediococcus acidilactici]
MKFAIRAQNLEYKLTETEENIVEYILVHQAEVVNMKIVTLAERFFTVPNTITRFCRKLGYGGFTELKVELRHELLEKQTGNQQLALIEENFGLVDEKREIKLAKLLQKAR